MRATTPLLAVPFRLAAACTAAFLLAATAAAQSATCPEPVERGGTILGRVFNPATKEYVRNAEVRIEGTDLVAYSGDDGSYQFTGVTAGEITLTVTYTGYDRATAKLTLGAGQTA